MAASASASAPGPVVRATNNGETYLQYRPYTEVCSREHHVLPCGCRRTDVRHRMLSDCAGIPDGEVKTTVVRDHCFAHAAELEDIMIKALKMKERATNIPALKELQARQTALMEF